MRFAGHAALWDRVDRAGDVFRAGAFAGAARVPLLRGHGGPAIGTVLVREDARGLWVEGEVRADLGGVRVGDGLSVGYRPLSVRQGALRELLAVELIEVSLVAVPMQPLARVTHVTEPRAAELAEDSAAPGGGGA